MKKLYSKIKTTPFSLLFKTLFFRMIRFLYCKSHRVLDHIIDTHSKNVPKQEKIWIFADINMVDISKINCDFARELLLMWESHRFDLLGSGWVRCGFINNAPGIMNCRYQALELYIDCEGRWLEKILAKRNIGPAMKIWKMVNPHYQPIDWQKDFKSGYRWDAKKWYGFIQRDGKFGADIKVPWELSRLQHFPRMAIFARVFQNEKDKIAEEFRNQCLDFIAQNPPRMGVNWKCTMDVGIRTANMALAFSLFLSLGYYFDKKFMDVFLTSIYEHCLHIYTNLEWKSLGRGNHYLSDVAGLLFGAALLPSSSRRKKWLYFAIKEVKSEIEDQFFSEGSNFEGSTAYHRLSSDIVAYAIALISGIENRGTSKIIADRLYGCAKFLETVTRPDNQFSQIGDNDSGMFFHLSPTGVMLTAEKIKKKYTSLSCFLPETENEMYLDENLNDGRPTISALSGLFENDDFRFASQQFPLEYSLIVSLCKGIKIRSSWIPPKVHFSESFESDFEYHSTQEISSDGFSLLPILRSDAFPAFGIYVFCSKNLYLLVNASENGQNGNGGHSHNDALSFELIINNNIIFQDPGTFVYTPLPGYRDIYRSVNSHNTVCTGIEQNEFVHIFSMKKQSKCSLLSISYNSISLLSRYQGVVHRRKWIIKNDKIIVIDDCNKHFQLQHSMIQSTVGYGKIVSNFF